VRQRIPAKLAAGDEVEAEPGGRPVRVAAERGPPVQARPCHRLDMADPRTPLLLEYGQSTPQVVREALQRLAQRQRVLPGHLCFRTHGAVRGLGSVAT